MTHTREDTILNSVNKVDFSLNKLIGTLSTAEFAEKYWTKSHYFVSHGASFFDSLLSLESFDKIMTVGTHDTMRLIKDHEVIPSDFYGYGHDKEKMIHFFNEGYSIVYESLNKTFEPLRDLCWNIKNAIPIAKKVYANAYFTPSTSQAFHRHADWQDVFILQIHGNKTWRLFEPTYNYPINTEQTKNLAPGLKDAKEIKEIVLLSGDMLYVPRGMPHEVYTTSDTSLHITLTVETITNYMALDTLLKSMVNDTEFLRTNVDLNFINDPKKSAIDILKMFASNTEVDYDLNRHELDFNSNMKGYFTDQEKSKGLSAKSMLTLRKNMSANFIPDGDSYIISTRFRRIQIDGVAEEIDFIRRGTPFMIESMPGDLDIDSKIELSKTLVAMGVLTLI